MPPSIALLIKNWKTTGPGLGLFIHTLWAMYNRYLMGESWFPNEQEQLAIIGGIGLIYAKAHNVTGGDNSNGLTPNPIQEVKAQMQVELAKADPEVVEKAPVDLVTIAKIQQDMLDLQAKLEKALGGK